MIFSTIPRAPICKILFPSIVAAVAVFGSARRAMSQENGLPINNEQASTSVVVSAQVAGRTPAIIGYNMGDNFPGSNVSSWLRYAEMNGARHWWPQNLWPDDVAPWNDNSLEKFNAERDRLRAKPLETVDWRAYEAAVARLYKGAPAGTLGSCYALSELHKMGVNVLVMLSRSTSKHAFDTADGAPDWFGRWTYWRGVYVNAFYLARYYDVERFQLFNEPDHAESEHIKQSDYLRRLQIGSDAIQAALADVNKIYGKALRVQISAPVTAGMMVFNARRGRPDTRDATIGWGELLMRHRKDDFDGRSRANQELFGVYAFQNYGRDAARIAKSLPELRALIAAANGGEVLPVIASEMNVSTAADFAKKPDTLDTLAYYAAFGAIAAAYTNAGIDEVYVFRLTQTDNLGDGKIKKNGTHIIDNRDPLKNILSSTKGAEAVRLWMRGFKDHRTRFMPPAASDKDIHTVAARDETDGTCTLMITNLGAARRLDVDLSAWKLPAGALTTIEEVSEVHHGDVSQTLALPASGKFSLPMKADSIALLTVRPTISGTPRAGERMTIGQNTVRLQKPTSSDGRVMLTLQAAATQEPMRVRVYGGEGDITQARLLGQIELQKTRIEATVDVTRAVVAAPQSLVFQLVPDNARDAGTFSISAAQLRLFEALPVKNR